ncbi:MAG: aldo/keto reductase [Ornithinimicrobium sp.]
MTAFPGPGIDLFPINLGGNPFGWTADEEASFSVLDAFTAKGGTFIDTADAYTEWVEGNEGGESETVLGNWMQARNNRDDVLIATKIALSTSRPGLSRDNVAAGLHDSLRRLQTDHIDVYYAHRDDAEVSIADQVATFHSLVQSGKVRAIGLSNYSAERLREWCDTAKREGMTLPAAIQPRYNLVSRREYEREIAPLVAEFELAVFCFPALASGFLTGKYRTEADFEGKARGSAARRYFDAGGLPVVDALVEIAADRGIEPATVAVAWLLAKGITAPIASASRPEQLDSVIAAPGVDLTSDEVSALDHASRDF